MKKAFSAVIKYLSDWRNWLVHGLVGVVLLVAIIWMPIAWWIKLIVLGLVVALNSVRMMMSAKKKKASAGGETSLESAVEATQQPEVVHSDEENNKKKDDTK